MAKQILALMILALVGCENEVDPQASITWGPESGLVIKTASVIHQGREIEIGQVIDEPTAVILDWVTIDGLEVFAETLDGRAEGFVIMTLPAPHRLRSGTMITHKLELADRTGLVSPLSVWFAVDGIELARTDF